MSSGRILAVDDDSNHLAALKRILRRSRYEVTVCANPRQALHLAISDPPDLILLDVNMPGMSGHEFLRRFRNAQGAAQQGNPTPVIFLSGLGAAQQRVSGLNAGAEDYITKPFDPEELRARIRSQIRRSRQQNANKPQSADAGTAAQLESACLPTVLCVDDEPAVLHSLERTLRRYGCRVLMASNGPVALDILSREQIEVLICDETMPDMCGTEVLRRAKEISPGTVRVMLTAHCGDRSVTLRAINSGEVFRLFAKPWENVQLCRAVADALGVEPEVWSQQRQRAARRLHAHSAASGGATGERQTIGQSCQFAEERK